MTPDDKPATPEVSSAGDAAEAALRPPVHDAQAQVLAEPGMLDTLRLAAFRFLLAESAFSQLGHNARLMAQAWLVLGITDSDTWVGVVNGVPAIPIAMLTLLGGTLVDRFNRRRILLTTRLVIASLGLLTAFLIATDAIRLWHLLVLSLGLSISNVLGMIAGQTILVDIVGRRQLLRANAIYSLTTNTGIFAGPAVAGVLVARIGVDAAFLLLAAAAVLAFGFASVMRSSQPPRSGTDAAVMRELVAGARYVWTTPVIRWLLVLSAFVMFVGVFQVTIPRIARDHLGLEADGYGAILAALGLGGLVGAVIQIAAGWLRAFAAILLAVGLAFSLTVILFAFAESTTSAAAAGFMIGFLFPWWGNTIRTAFQTAATDEMRGRASSLFTLAGQMIPLGWLVGGAMSDAFGPRTTLLVAGGAVAVAYTFVYLRSAELRRLGRE